MRNIGVLGGIPLPRDTSDIGRGDGQALQPGLKLWLYGERRILGPGAVRLLLLVKETNSIKQACCAMDLSYSKGRKMVLAIEQELGCEVLHKHQGGRTGGYSTLTDIGEDLISRYEAFETECRESVQTSFDKHFGGLGAKCRGGAGHCD